MFWLFKCLKLCLQNDLNCNTDPPACFVCVVLCFTVADTLLLIQNSFYFFSPHKHRLFERRQQLTINLLHHIFMIITNVDVDIGGLGRRFGRHYK